MAWPLSQDYNEALQNLQTSFSDAELRQGQVVTNALGIPQPCSGNFADVYAVECAASKTKWAVKCFTRQVSGLSERYSEISKYLRLAKLPFTVDFHYLEQGIRVRGQWYPILKMQWVEGFVLNAFVRDNLDKKPILQALGHIWLRMARRLRESYIAHCDLQHGNVMFVPGSSAHSLAVKLIDYDGMCVPSLVGTQSGEVGHPAYQHPERLRTGAYNQEVDRFSLLSIAAALRCLAVGGRSLWQRYDNGDNLLFCQADFQSPAESPLFRELLTIDDAQARLLVQELYRACQGPLDAVPLLTDLLPEEKPASKAKATVAKQPAAAQGSNWDFPERETGKPVAAKKPPATSKTSGWVWGGIAGAAALVLLGGVLIWATSSKSPSEKTPNTPDPQQVRVKPKDNKSPRPIERSKPDDPPTPAVKPQPEDVPPPVKPKPDETPAKPAETAIPIPYGPLGQVRDFEGHTVGVFGVAFSPDGKRALSASGDRTVRLWNVATGEQIHCLNGHTNTVWAVSFSPDGKRAASAGFDHTVRIWDLDRGEQLHVCKGHGANVRSAVFTPDGKQVLSTSHDHTVRVWDAETGQEVRQYKGNKSDAYWLTLSSDGKRVLCGGGDKMVRCWDAESGKELAPYEGSTGVLYTVAISHDGKYVAAGGSDKSVRIWAVGEPAAPLHSLTGHTGQVNALSFTPNGRLLSASADGTIRLWDMASGKELGCFYGPEGVQVFGVAASPDGRGFLSGGSDKLMRLWRLPPPDVLAGKPDDPVKEVQTFTGHEAKVRRVAFSFDGRRILSAGYDTTARLWETATGREVLAFKGHTHPHVHTAVFLPDGRRALSGGQDRVIRLWDLRDGHEIRALEGSKDGVFYLAISPDGRRVASSGPEPAVLLWDVEKGELIRRLEGLGIGANCVCFSPDGRQLLTSCGNGTIALWDATNDEAKPRLFPGHTVNVASVCFSPDGRQVLSASADKTLRLWDVASGKELRRFEGHTDQIEAAALSPDGRRAVSGSIDRTVRLWDVASGKELHRFDGHTDKIWDVAFSPDGRYVVSASEDKTLKLWRVPFEPFVVGRPLEIKAEPAPVAVPVPVPVVARLPVPDEATQKKATEDIRDIYKSDYLSRQPDDLVVLAGKLLKRGQDNQEEPGRRFVYLREARDQAARGGDLAVCFRAIDEMTKAFAVEPLPLKTAALERATAAIRSKDAGKTLAEQLLAVLDETEAADDYEQAGKLMAVAPKIAPKAGDPYLTALFVQRKGRVERLRKEYAKIADAVRTLAEKPDNAEANLIAGKFQCFDKENWDKGLPLLARGGDSTLADLARKDLAKPMEAAGQESLGQAWWGFAEKEKEARVKAAVQQRAKHWLYAALPSLGGTDADRVASQLELKVKIKKGTIKFTPGLVAEYFAGENFERKVTTRMDYTLQHDWGLGGPAKDVPADHFSIRWQGWLFPPRRGKYTFAITADDGAKLILDGQTAIDCWGQTRVERHSKEIELSAEPHLLQVEFREAGVTAHLSLTWKLEHGFAEQAIPLKSLYHDSKQERLLAP